MTTDKYDESLRRLKTETAAWPPEGMEYHCAFNAGGSFRVSEVWESKEKFEAFGQTLMPILSEIGIELAGEPEVLEVYNAVKG